MMKNQVEKLVKKGRRVMAFAMAVAMLMSMFSPASFVEAAKWKKPALSVKKKTLYYNKAGKKTYTLKVKKNNVKKIKKTTWKTSKKSVIAISKKKKTSVKLKAKKEGKATITATIKYVPKGMWMVRTLKLKCKVTSKKSGKAPKPSVKPTAQPSNVVKKVTLDSTKEILGTAAEKNTVTLTATVFNANGKEMDIDEDDIKWTSSSKKVATVDDEGNVKAVKAGTANITASYGGVKSAPCVIVVDSTAPEVKEAVVTNVNTITVYFSEAVKGEPEVSVEKKDEDSTESLDSKKIKAVLAKDGKSMTVTYEEELTVGKYTMTIDGLSDMAGNELAEDTKVTFEKLPSTPTKLVGVTKQIPAGQENAKVYFKVLDQYNKEMAVDTSISSGITADVKTENGMPLDANIKYDDVLQNCYVEISDTEWLPVNRKIVIDLSHNKTVKGKITVTIVNSNVNAGEATSIAGFNVNDNIETAYTSYLLKPNETISIKAIFLNEFGGLANASRVSYRIDNKDVLTFGDGTVSQTSVDGKTSVIAKGKGKATITAYLLSSEKNAKFTVTVTDEVVVENIIISDEVKVSLTTPTSTSTPTSTISLSKGNSVNTEKYDTVQFDFEVYDKNGKRIEINDEAKPNEYICEADSKAGQVVVVPTDNFGEFSIITKPGEVINDNLEITITHILSRKTATVTVPVSNEISVPNLNECEIVRDGEDENLCGKTYEINPAKGSAKFNIQITDQYGAVVHKKLFATVTSSDKEIATVENIGGDSKQSAKNNTFEVKPKSIGETTITVFITSKIIYTFTVKVVEEINVVTEFKQKAEKFNEIFYNRYQNHIFSASDITDNEEKKEICYFKIPIKGANITENNTEDSTKKDIKEVFLGDKELISDSAQRKVSIGNNSFIPLADYVLDEDGSLLISYLFIALNDVDENGKMRFKIKFDDDSKAEAVLKVAELSEDLRCTSIKPFYEESQKTVTVASGRDKDKELSVTSAGELKSTNGIRECTLELKQENSNSWKHMVLLKFEINSVSDYKPQYYFTKKVVGNNVSYGFTAAEKNSDSDELLGLGYYPYHYSNLGAGEKITDYTVATVDRHSVSNIKLIQKRESTGITVTASN